MGKGVRETNFLTSTLFSPFPSRQRTHPRRWNFFETSPRRAAFMELRILTVKFRNDNQQTKFRVTDGTEVHCFKSVRSRSGHSSLKLRSIQSRKKGENPCV